MDMVSALGPVVGLKVGETMMKVSIHEDNVGAFILAQKLVPKYTPHNIHYAITIV